ncbi:MAG: polyphosphate kinase 1 [Myxococcaceae bacterium]
MSDLPVSGDLNDARLFLNRELSWLAFNERVLREASNPGLPLYERIRFLALFAANLDEFFMVRVAGLKQQLAGGVAAPEADGLLPVEQLAAISERAHSLVAQLGPLWLSELLPALGAAGVSLLSTASLEPARQTASKEHFHSSVFPALTPLAVDPGHPFPHLRNKTLNIAAVLRRDPQKGRPKRAVHETELAVVPVPSVMPRLVPLPSPTGHAYVLLEDLICRCLGDLFPGFTVEHAAAFRVTRNWDLAVDEEESEDLLASIQDDLKRRERGATVRLELDAGAPDALEEALKKALHLGAEDVYRSEAPLQLSDLVALAERDPRPELRVEPFSPVLPPGLREAETQFPLFAQRDVLLHHPYESYDPVVRFIDDAADDPAVLAIKQTLYRLSAESPIAQALCRAAENGKQVAVLVELKARLDEANNIAWARQMEEAGVHVVYGLLGLKTHCKVALVVRRETGGIRRYVHLGTGDYNGLTARHYTDVSLFTSREEIADDVTALFNMLTGYSVPPKFKRLVVAPFNLLERLLQLIEREADRARSGEPARIVAKMNNLVDASVIRALYRASQAGVRVDLLVRGICCLRPGLPGVSEHIRVTSVVDRFLEHTRLFAFGARERAEVFLTSADWMPRNFHRRIEVMVPVEDPGLRSRLLEEVLGLGLRDTAKAMELTADGSYLPVTPHGGGPGFRSQMAALELVRRHDDSKGADARLRHAPGPAESPATRNVPPA